MRRSAFRLLSRCFRLWLAVVLTASCAWLHGADAPARPKRTLQVSSAIDHFPYSFRDEPGHLTGFGVDLFNAVARTMSLDFSRVELTALEDLQRFDAGEFDVAQLHPLLPNERLATYSAPVLVLHGAIFVRKGDHRFKSMDDLRQAGARIATPNQGYAFAVERGIDGSLLTMTSSVEALRMLSAGEVDAVLVTRLTGLAQAGRLGIRNVEPVGPSLEGFTVRYCLAVHPGDEVLLTQLNEGLAILHQTGEFGTIYERWFSRYEPTRFSREQVIAYVAGALAIALVLVLWALQRQHYLRRRIAHQAAELDESRSILAEAQRFARLGHWQRGIDTEAPETVWSDETYRIFERDPARGPPAMEELIRYADPAQQTQWRESLQQLLRDGGSYDFDIVIEPRAGVRKTVHIRGRERLDKNGRRIGAFGTVQDVTAWRAAESALRQSEQLLRVLYGNLPLALGVVERSGGEWSIVSLNPEGLRRFQTDAESASGRAISTLGLSPAGATFWTQNFDLCADAAIALKVDTSLEDGKREYAVTFVPLGRDGDRARCCFLMEDVTERKAKDEEIARGRRLRAIGELVGGIAHEFNNLLTPVLLKSDMLRVEWSTQPALQEELKVIADAARRAAALTRRLLTFGRSSDRRPEWIDLPAVVTANIDLLRDTIDRRISFSAELPGDLPRLFLSSVDLHQIILNLLLNARDTLTTRLARANPPDWRARIRIDAAVLPPHAVVPFAPLAKAPADSWMRLTVRDNGEGMPPDVLERIFEPFYTTKEVGQGTGLGLATIWHLVTEIGGRVDVESVVGEGSAFHVSLPVRSQTPTVAPAEKQRAPGVALEKKRRKVLVAEDEDAIAQLLAKVLRREKHEIVLVSNGLVAWEHLSASPEAFDLVMMDLNMPGLSGLELARRARAIPYDRPLIVMSGRVGEEERAEMTRLRIDAILNKPFDIGTLLATLASVLPTGR